MYDQLKQNWINIMMLKTVFKNIVKDNCYDMSLKTTFKKLISQNKKNVYFMENTDAYILNR